MLNETTYPIGTPGQKWGEAEKKTWFERQKIKRSYATEVLANLEGLKARFDVVQYGALPIAPDRYPLFLVRSRHWDASNPNILVTGGVHGYETSGVQGALSFAQTRAADYEDRFNFLVAPCISPWGYETINRWNPSAIDPNRSFKAGNSCEESASLMHYLGLHPFLAHFDLHETTDTDNSEFRPALNARDAIQQEFWHIPDGFYVVGDTHKPEPEFQAAIIRSVEKITHIAPPDANGKIIGELLEQHGVINYATKEFGLCSGFTDAPFVTTTEVYPDSPRVDAENCILAQVTAVAAGLDYLGARLRR